MTPPDPFEPRTGDRWVGGDTTLTVLAVDLRGEGSVVIKYLGGTYQMPLFDLVESLVEAVRVGTLWAPRSPGWA